MSDYKDAAARLRARLGPVGGMQLISEPATAERAAARRR